MAEPLVYLVPYLDGDWLGYGPLDPDMNFGILPATRKEIDQNLKIAVGFWKERTGGKMVFGAHSGTYCRELFYEEPALQHYRDLIANGGEIAVHPHEERINAGHMIGDLEHMRYIISWKRQQLNDAGIRPTSLRLPYNGYVAGLTKIAEDNDLLVDMSAATGFVRDYWSANWKGAPATAFMLDYEDQTNPRAEGARRSRVLEIPMGWDGVASKVGHYLFNEQIELDRLIAIWDATVERAKRDGPQMIYLLSHLHSMPDPELYGRLSRLLDHALSHSGVPVTPTEAYRIYPTIATQAAWVKEAVH